MTASGESRELWEQCVDWLKSAGVLEQREVFVRLADFAATLRNGVLLCELALRLQPGCIDRNQMLIQYQHSPFTCSKNIALFLDACRQHFGVEQQVFNEDDLYRAQNFAAVLRLLSQLSRHQIARKLGLRPFPEETTLPCDAPDEENNNIYSNLRDELEERRLSQQYAVISKPSLDDEDVQKVYDTICAQNVPSNNNNFPLTQSYAEFKPTSKREHCLKELLDTEINYDNALKRIVDLFFTRLHFYLQSDDQDTIFINIQDILRMNLEFLAKLKPAVLHALDLERTMTPRNKEEHQPVLHVGEVFVAFKQRFTIYAKYCALLSASTKRVEELERRDPEFKRIVSELAKDSQFRLQALLSIPFQRITKYHLLLDNLANYTQNVGGQTMLRNAHEAMKDVCDYVNEMKRDHEAIEFINTIQRSISALDGTNLVEFGRLLCDDTVKVAAPSSSSKQRYVFLFERLLLLCKKESGAGMYKRKEWFRLADFELQENELDPAMAGGGSFRGTQNLSRKLTNVFDSNTSLAIVRRDGGGASNGGQPASVQLVFKTSKQRDEWREMLRRALEANNPREATAKGHSLLYKTYNCSSVSGVVSCAVCKLLLRGKFFQGYHCSGCNRDMHRECASLRECTLRRSDEFNTTGNGTLRSNSLAVPKLVRSVQNFLPGEIVVSRQFVPPDGSARLSCQSGDLVELLEVNESDGTALARLNAQPQMVGTVSLDGLARTAQTLERIRRRHSHVSNHSLVQVIPLRSPCSQVASTPPISEIQVTINNNHHQQQQQRQQQLSTPFVSSCIIALSELENRQDVTEQPWYFGELGRPEAKQLLEGTEEGTFIVRWSTEQQKFVISFCARDADAVKVKQVKIEYDAGIRKYYLHNQRHFDTVVELVSYYRTNSLAEGFQLDAVLRGTLLKGNTFRAVNAFSRSDSSRYLTLRRGDLVTVLGTAGDGNGWWKGAIGERIGFFPVSYVESVAEPRKWEEGEVAIASDNLSAYQNTENGRQTVRLSIQQEGAPIESTL